MKVYKNHQWPTSDLENVINCPYCGSEKRTLIYQSVRDYFFLIAPGEWDYWECADCRALYLNPRPTEDSIGRAYTSYYTHSPVRPSFFRNLKLRLKYECFSHWLGVNLKPRFGLPKLIGYLLFPLKHFIRIPFEVMFLATSSRGKLIDVGCGGGVTLSLARQMGWRVSGLELDPLACKAANNIGLNVIQGDYSKLSEITEKFDCVLCSHVLEHVHDPVNMLGLMAARMKVNGHLILSLPNAHSDLRFRFGKFWRGLEAPRHISIPTINVIISILESLGYVDIIQHNLYEETYWKSLCIERKESSLPQKSLLIFKLGRLLSGKRFTKTSDYIQLVARKV